MASTQTESMDDRESVARLLYWCGCSEWEFVVEGVESLPAGEVVIEVVYSGVLVMGCGVRLDFPLPPSHGLLLRVGACTVLIGSLLLQDNSTIP